MHEARREKKSSREVSRRAISGRRSSGGDAEWTDVVGIDEEESPEVITGGEWWRRRFSVAISPVLYF